MRRIFLVVLLLLCAASLFAQATLVTVTATITDPDGHALAGAPFIVRLVNSAGYTVSSVSTPNGSIFNAKPTAGFLDAAGSFSIQLVPNSILSNPNGTAQAAGQTRWAISIGTPEPVEQSNILTYQPPWAINYSANITGAVDLSSQLSALATNVTYFNVKTGQSTLAGWLIGSGSPTLPCGPGVHEGYFYTNETPTPPTLYQCFDNNGTYGWSQVGGGSTTGVTSVQGTAPIQVNGDSGTPHTGATVVACPSCGGGTLLQQITGLPTGQHALIFPSACTAGPSTVSSCFANGASGSGSIVCEGECFFGIGNGVGSWSSWALPAGWSQANVTQVIAVSVGSNYGSPGEEEYTCTDGTHDTTLGGLGSGYGQITSTFGTIPTVASTHCDFLISSSLVGAPSTAGNIASIALAVYDSVDPPVTPPSTTGVMLPLIVTNNILQLSSPFYKGLDTGTVNAYQVVIPLLTNGPEIGDGMTLFVANANTITAPTVTVLNTLDHAAYPIINQDGTALIASQLQPSIPYYMIFDGTSWRVQSVPNTNITVNGTTIVGANFNDSSPAAPSGAVNNKWQHTSNSVSSYTPAATGTTPGVIKPDGSTCTVASGVLTCTGSGGANANLQNAVVLSPSCGSSLNCVTVFDDTQVAMTAAYGTTLTGATATVASIGATDDSGAQYGVSPVSGSQNVTFETNSSIGYDAIVQAFKTTGTPAVLGCWGAADSNASPAIISVSPTGGSGHALIAFSRAGTSTVTITFSDANSQTWIPLLGSPLTNGQAFNGAFVENVVGGTYNIQAAYSGGTSNNSIFACEVTNIATSSAADGAAGTSTGTTTASVPFSTTIAPTAANDFVFEGMTVHTLGLTYTAGVIDAYLEITTQTSDPPFISTDVGKKFVANTACDSGNGYVNCQQGIGAGTISNFIDSHHVGVNGSPIQASSSTGTNFTGWFAWGHDDTTAIQSAWATALTTPSMSLYLPCGIMMISAAPFISASTGGANNPNIRGCAGQSGTVLVPTADFNYSAAASSGAFIYKYLGQNETGFGNSSQNPYLWSEIDDLTVAGMGYGGNGLPSFNIPIFTANLTKMRNVHVTGWLWDMSSVVPIFSVQTIIGENIGGWASGTAGIQIEGNQTPSSLTSSLKDCFFGAQAWFSTPAHLTSGSLTVDGGANLVSSNCIFNPPTSLSPNSDQAVSVNRGSTWNSFGDQFGGMTVNNTAFAFLHGSSSTYLSHYGITNISFIQAESSQIDQLVQTAGSFTDLGGNYSCPTAFGLTACPGGYAGAVSWTNNPRGGTSITGGRVIGVASVHGVANEAGLVSGDIALTSGWGSGSVGTVKGDAVSGSFVITEGGSPGASPVLTLTFPDHYAVAPASCTIQQTAGNFTLSNPVTSSLTATGVVFTWTGTPGATDSYTFAFRCGN